MTTRKSRAWTDSGGSFRFPIHLAVPVREMTLPAQPVAASSSSQTPARRLVNKASLPTMRSQAQRMPIPIAATAPSSPMIASDAGEPSSETPGKSRAPSVSAPKSRAGSSRRVPTLGSRMIRTFSSQQGPTEMGPSRLGFNPASSKYFIVAIPPADLPSEPPHPRAPASAPNQNAARRGSLLPLYPTLGGQLYAIAREHGLPSIGGMMLYLCDDGEGNLGPRIGEDTWTALWAQYFEEPAEESYDDRYRQHRSPRLRRPSTGSSASPHLLRDNDADASLSTTESDEIRSNAPRSASRNQSSAFGTSPRSPYTSRENGMASRASGSQAAFGRLPIVARLEWAVDKHRAPWWSSWTAEADMSSSMSVRSVGSRAPPTSTAGGGRRSLHLAQQPSVSLMRTPPSWATGSPVVLRTTRAGSLGGPTREPVDMSRVATMPPFAGTSTPPNNVDHKRQTVSSGVGETSQSVSGSEDQLAPRSSAVSEVSLSAPGGSTSPEAVDFEVEKGDDLGGYARLDDDEEQGIAASPAPLPAITAVPLPESPVTVARAIPANEDGVAPHLSADANHLAVSPSARTEMMPSSEGASGGAASYAGYSALLDTEDGEDDEERERRFRSSPTQELDLEDVQGEAPVVGPAAPSASNTTTNQASRTLDSGERHVERSSVGSASVPVEFKLMPDDEEGMWRDLHGGEAPSPGKPASDDFGAQATPRPLADAPSLDRLSARSLSLHRISHSPEINVGGSPFQRAGNTSLTKGSAVQEWIAKTSSTERISRRSQVLGPTSFDDNFAPSESRHAESESGFDDDGEPLLPPEDDIGDVMKLWAEKGAAGQASSLEPPAAPNEASLATMRQVTDADQGSADAAAAMRTAKLALLSPIALDGAGASGAFSGPKPQLGDLSGITLPLETAQRPPVPAPQTSTGSSNSLDTTMTGKNDSPRLGTHLSSPLLHPTSSPSLQPPSPHSPGAQSVHSSSTDLSDTLMDMERALELLSPSASQAGNSPAPGSSFDVGPSPLEFRKPGPLNVGTPSPRLLRPRDGPNPIQRAAFRASTSAQQAPKSSLGEVARTSPRPASTGAVPAGIKGRLSDLRIPSTASALAAQLHDGGEEEDALDATPKAAAKPTVAGGESEGHEYQQANQAAEAELVDNEANREAAIVPLKPVVEEIGAERAEERSADAAIVPPRDEVAEPTQPLAKTQSIDGEATERGVGSTLGDSPDTATARLASEADADDRRSSIHSESAEVDFWKPQPIEEELEGEARASSSIRGASDHDITPQPRSTAQFAFGEVHASPRPESQHSILSTYSTQLQDRFTQTVSSTSADDLSGFIIEPRPRDSANSLALEHIGASAEDSDEDDAGLHSRNDSIQTTASAQTDVPPSVRRMIRGQSFAESSEGPSPAQNSPADVVITDPFSQPRTAPVPPVAASVDAPKLVDAASSPMAQDGPNEERFAPAPEPESVPPSADPTAAPRADESDEEWSQDGSDYDDDATQATSRKSRRSHLSVGSHYFADHGTGSNAAETPTFLYDQHLADNGRSPLGTPGSRRPSPNPAGKASPAPSASRSPAPGGHASDTTALGITLSEGVEQQGDVVQPIVHAAPQPRPANFGTDMQALANSDGSGPAIANPSPRPSMDEEYEGESEFEHRLDAMLDNIESIDERGFPGTSAAMAPSSGGIVAKTLITEADPFARRGSSVTADEELRAMHMSTSSAVRSALTAHDDSAAPPASAVLSDVSNLGGGAFVREPRRSLSGDGPSSPLSKPPSLRRGSGSSTASGSRRHRSPVPTSELRRGSNGSVHGKASSPSLLSTGLPASNNASPRARFKALPPSPALTAHYAPNNGWSPSHISPISSPTSHGGAGSSAWYVRRGSGASAGGGGGAPSPREGSVVGPMAMPSYSATHSSAAGGAASIYGTTPPSRQGTPSRPFHVGSPSTAMVQPLGAQSNASLADFA